MPKNWDKYYLDLCITVSSNSSCFSRKLGAIVVMDKSVISTGYNGPPRGVSPCDTRWGKDMYLAAFEDAPSPPYVTEEIKGRCPRHVLGFKSGQGLDVCIAGHAERNALINAARHGIAVKGATLYLNTAIPCSQCLVEIINAGIVEIVCTEKKYYDGVSPYIVEESGIKIREFAI